MPVANCQSDEPPPPVRVHDVEVARPRPVIATIEAGDAVERELVARAIALGEVDAALVGELLEHPDWTLRHLALDALARTCVSRVTLTRPHGDSIDRALRDPRVELRVAAIGANSLQWQGSAGPVLRMSGDAAPEVRLALARELGAIVPLHGEWPTPDGEVPARLVGGNDSAAELVRRLAWTKGPSLTSVGRAFSSLAWGASSWLAAQPAEALVPGAWTALARDHAERCGGDPWSTIVTCFEECLAYDDWRRGPLAQVLHELANTPVERSIAAALMAHVRPLTRDEAETLAAGALELCTQFGIDDAARVLLPTARLASPELAAALLHALPGASLDSRELLLRCAAEALGPTALADLELDADSELLIACARNALLRDTLVAGDHLERFAGHEDLSVREALYTLALDALSSGRAAMAVPLLERMLHDPESGLASSAFRALAGADVAPETEARLHHVWRALPDESTQRNRLRDLSRGARWPSFRDDLLRIAAEAHATEFVELLAPLVDDPSVHGTLQRWFVEDVAALCAAQGFEAKLVLDGRLAGLAKALHEGRGLQPDGQLAAAFERALVATMHGLHPPGERSRAKLPKSLVALMGVDTAGRAALERVLVATNPRAPRRVRTEAAIVLAWRLEGAPVELASLVSIVDALVDSVTESEPELAVRAVRACIALPRPAREVCVARLLAQWSELGDESVRIAVAEVAVEEPLHYATLQGFAEAASDDTVAGALIEAMAASRHGREESLAALARFEAVAGGAASAGDGRGARPLPKLTVEQALVRREAVLLGFARAAEPLPDDVAARVLVRPLALARGDLAAAFLGEPVAGAEFRFRGELAIGEALARERRLGAFLVPSGGTVPAAGPELGREKSSSDWWEVDAELLAALARCASQHEPATAARLAEAALVAQKGLPDGHRGRDGRASRTALLALWLAAEAAAGEQRDTSSDSAALAIARSAHLERAALVAGELVAGLALTNLERGLPLRDPRGVDLRTVERVFGAADPSLGVDPRARLCAAVQQLPLLALLERRDLQGLAWAEVFGRGPSGRTDWVARSREARALEDRIDTRRDALAEERANEAARELHPDRERR